MSPHLQFKRFQIQVIYNESRPTQFIAVKRLFSVSAVVAWALLASLDLLSRGKDPILVWIFSQALAFLPSS